MHKSDLTKLLKWATTIFSIIVMVVLFSPNSFGTVISNSTGVYIAVSSQSLIGIVASILGIFASIIAIYTFSKESSEEHRWRDVVIK
jgi:hypothetical protein